MSVIDAVGRITEIQSTLGALRAPSQSAPAASSQFAHAMTTLMGATATEPTAGAVSTGDASGSDVVATAKKYLGVPYVFGGEDSSGMDCSGLVQRVYADLGIDLPRVVPDQARMGTEVGSLADAQPGDLIVAKGSGHILIYAGDNKVIHAPRPGTSVSLVENWRTDADIETIRRIVPTAPAAVPSPQDALSASSIDALMLAAQRSLLGGSL
ncbi:MAG: C40 family peptidase [Microbacterium sp.]